MNKLVYYIFLLFFPLFFVIHGVNENFGLISFKTIALLFLKYAAITLTTGFIARIFFKSINKAFLFAFLTLCFYFFFGSLKDLLGKSILARYSILLPALVVLLVVFFVMIRKNKTELERTIRWIQLFLVIILLFDGGLLTYNFLSNKLERQDFGDSKNLLLDSLKTSKPIAKPDIYWIIIDEYASSRVLKEYFNVSNPLDSFLISKGFFVADSASSNYNYTHFSLPSQLDMVYLDGFNNHSIVTPADAMRGNLSLFRNNTCKFLQSIGYKIENLSIYDIENYPTKGMTPFYYTPRSLIDNQTLSGKISRDLGWQLPILFKPDREKAKKEMNHRLVEELDINYKKYHQQLASAISKNASEQSPVFLMAHLFDAHEPFIYNADGSLYREAGLNATPANRYIPQLLYSNTVLEQLINLIQSTAKKDYVIILQGDHGFKFEESDPLFDRESGSTLFTVFYRNGVYTSWPRNLTTVNAFRILFNDKFQTSLPLLPNRTHNLLYRSKGDSRP